MKLLFCENMTLHHGNTILPYTMRRTCKMVSYLVRVTRLDKILQIVEKLTDAFTKFYKKLSNCRNSRNRLLRYLHDVLRIVDLPTHTGTRHLGEICQTGVEFDNLTNFSAGVG